MKKVKPCFKNITERKRRRLLFIILQPLVILLTALIVFGCESEQLVNKPDISNNYNSFSGINQHDPKSNEGSLDINEKKKADMIKPGDQLQIMVWGYPEFNTTSTVKEYGTVTIPLIGEVMAAGLTQDEFTSAVKERLSEYVKGDPRLTISHIEMDRRVSVMGAVNKQDNYPALSDEPLVEIIAAAGGPATGADLRHVKIFRNGRRNDVIEVDLTEHLEKGDMESIPRVKPGDTVFVPKEENFMRELSDYARDVLLLFGFFRLLN